MDSAIKKACHTLGVTEDASLTRITQRYRELLLKHHPDKSGHSNTDVFLEIQRAFEILSQHSRNVPHEPVFYEEISKLDFSTDQNDLKYYRCRCGASIYIDPEMFSQFECNTCSLKYLIKDL